MPHAPILPLRPPPNTDSKASNWCRPEGEGGGEEALGQEGKSRASVTQPLLPIHRLALPADSPLLPRAAARPRPGSGGEPPPGHGEGGKGEVFGVPRVVFEVEASGKLIKNSCDDDDAWVD